MAELGVVASIVNIADLTTKVAVAATKYAEKVKNVVEDMTRIRNEVQQLHDVLEQLREKSQKTKELDKASRQWQSIATLESEERPLAKTKAILQSLLQQLDPRSISKVERLLWPRKAKKLERDVALVVKQKEQFMDLLNIDAAFQTAEIDEKVSNLAQRDVDREIQAALEWLSGLDHTADHHVALEQRTDNTGRWLLERPEYCLWEDKGGLFWLRGAAGAGKTILTSLVIDALANNCKDLPGQAAAYFYFKDAQRHQPADMLRSIVAQMCLKSTQIPIEAARLLQDSYSVRELPDSRRLAKILSLLTKGLERAFIVIDALDECRSRDVLFRAITDIMSMDNPERLWLFVSSRELPDFQRVLSSRCTSHVHLGSDNDVDGHNNKDDIRRFIESSIAEQHYLNAQTDEVKEKVMTALSGGAKGMFRWVKCQIDRLSEPLTGQEVLDVLQDLPKDLEETYSRILDSIMNRKNGKRYITMAQRVFTWLATAQRPMFVDELAQAINQEPGHVSLSKQSPFSDAIFEICGSLVMKARDRNVPEAQKMKEAGGMSAWTESPHNWGISVATNRQRETIEFAHYSVKEYLVSSHISMSAYSMFAVNEDEAAKYAAKTCLLFVLQFNDDNFDAVQSMKSHQFLEYACDYWPSDIAKGRANPDQDMRDLLARLFDAKNLCCYNNWAAVYDPLGGKFFKYHQQRKEDTPLPLAYLAQFNLIELCKKLLVEGMTPNASQNQKRCPLQIASIRGHEEVVRLLLAHGATVNNFGFQEETALIAAVRGGHEQIARLLIDNGIDINRFSSRGASALALAIRSGQYDIVELLLSHNANVNIPTRLEMNPLESAISRRDKEIIERLLLHGADASMKGLQGSALHAACVTKDAEIVSLLLAHGVDANSFAQNYGRVLNFATFNLQVDIVQILLANGADPNSYGGGQGRPLHCAITRWSPYLIQVLLSHGADPNGTHYFYGTVLYHAAQIGFTEAVVMLIDHGADLGQNGGLRGTPMEVALEEGYYDIVKLFVTGEQYEEILQAEYGSTLQGTIAAHDMSLLRSLLTRGLDVNAPGSLGTPLQAACYADNHDAVQLLLEHHARINALGGEYGTALQAACLFASRAIVELLLEQPQIDVNLVGGKHGSALQGLPHRKGKPLKAGDHMFADPNMHKSNCHILDLLIKHGANVNIGAEPYGSPLISACAAKNASTSLVGAFIKYGADVNFHQTDYGSPLQAALYSTSPWISETLIKILLKAGADPYYEGGKHGSVKELVAKKREYIKVFKEHGIDFSNRPDLAPASDEA